jgi:hypothetical protein
MIGKTIKSIITTNAALIALVPPANMFPYVIDYDTTLPSIIYKIDSLTPGYNKGGWSADLILFSISSFTRDYASLQTIVSAIRVALEGNQTGTGTQDINRIYLDSFEEGYDIESDIFYNKLTFKVTINKY